MPPVLRKIARKGLRNLFGVDVHPVLDEGWAEEREYWGGVLREFYRSNYGLEFHPLQSDESLVAPLETVVKLQRANKADHDAFFASGYRATLNYQTELLDYGCPANRMQSILEMGVGLGRLIVHYFPFQARLYGCDLLPDAVAWTRSKLGHRVEIEQTGAEPPLPYDDGMFDFVYANSVFTHVRCASMEAWAAELRRIVRPGGMLIFSVLDPTHYVRNVTYRDFHRDYEMPGCRGWYGGKKGDRAQTYLDRRYLLKTWGAHFRVFELRGYYRDQSHLICKREA